MNKTEQTADRARLHLGLGVIRLNDDGPISVQQAANLRREAEYVARRNGLKAPLLQLWKVVH